VTLSAYRARQRRSTVFFGLISLVFIYTTVTTIAERPEGLRIALIFIGIIITTSILSRLLRTTELRSGGVLLDAEARRFLEEAGGAPLRVIANNPERRDRTHFERKEREQRALNRFVPGEPIVFLEVTVRDPSEFAPVVTVSGEERYGHRVLRAEGASVPNTMAVVLLHLRDVTGAIPHAYFGWSEANPLAEIASFVFFGEGDIAPVTREILREAEPDPERRPIIHVA
jgi:hypothetical protein